MIIDNDFKCAVFCRIFIDNEIGEFMDKPGKVVVNLSEQELLDRLIQ